MSFYSLPNPAVHVKRILMGDYRGIWLLASSAVVLSSAVIIYYNHKMYQELIANAYGILELIAITLMPYMISAVVATITATGIMSMLPVIKSKQTAARIHKRMKELGDGDLTTGPRIETGNPYLKDISHELTYIIGTMSSAIAQWKIINRQQWDLLENIRQEALSDGHPVILSLVEKMEENWKMVAQIEGRFRT